jgi:hypothetical protein
MLNTYEVEAIYHTPCTCKPGCTTGVFVDRVKVYCEAQDADDASRQFYAMPDVVEILSWTFKAHGDDDDMEIVPWTFNDVDTSAYDAFEYEQDNPKIVKQQ